MTKLACACIAIVAFAALGAGCASAYKNDSEREWAKAECRNIIDNEARTKCLERTDR